MLLESESTARLSITRASEIAIFIATVSHSRSHSLPFSRSRPVSHSLLFLSPRRECHMNGQYCITCLQSYSACPPSLVFVALNFNVNANNVLLFCLLQGDVGREWCHCV